MKKTLLLIIFLLLSVVLIACNNEIQEAQKKEEASQVYNQETETKKVIVESVEKVLPAFEAIDTPSISLLSSEGYKRYQQFDSLYGEVCWNNCEEFNHYNYPDIHSGEVEVGNQLLIDWSLLIPQPTEVYFIHVDTSNEIDSKEISKEQKTTGHTTLTIKIEEKMIGNQYAVEFIWKDGEVVEGRSILNFRLE